MLPLLLLPCLSQVAAATALALGGGVESKSYEKANLGGGVGWGGVGGVGGSGGVGYIEHALKLFTNRPKFA